MASRTKIAIESLDQGFEGSPCGNLRQFDDGSQLVRSWDVGKCTAT
jgi:hypothetical protein